MAWSTDAVHVKAIDPFLSAVTLKLTTAAANGPPEASTHMSGPFLVSMREFVMSLHDMKLGHQTM